MATTTTPLQEYRRIMHNGEAHYGQHLIATAQGCNEAILSIDSLTDFLKTMADEIDMVRYGEPLVARFGGGIETGISGVQLIETSAIVIHTNDAHRDLYLDVFSCKEFKEETVRTVLDEFLHPASVTSEVFYRR